MFASLRQASRVPAAIGLVAFLVFAPGFWWGAPHATAPDRKLSWGTDDETPLGPLAEIHNIIQPKKDRNLGYPLMYSFMTAAAYTPYLGLLYVSGDFEKVTGAYPFGLKDPVRTLKVLTAIAHLLTALLGAGVVVCAFVAGRILWGPRAGFVAAALMVTSYPYFYYARTGNVDVPMTFFVAVALTAYAAMVRRAVTTPLAIVLGAAMGFALGTKEACYGIFVPIPVVLLYLHYKRKDAAVSLSSVAFLKPIVVTAVVAILAFGFGSGLFIEPSRYFAHLEFHRELAAAYASGETAHELFDRSAAGYVRLGGAYLGHLADTHTWPGLLLAGIGFGLIIKRRRWADFAAVLPALSYLALMASRLSVSTLRQMLPSSIVFALLAGYAVHEAYNARANWMRYGAVAIASTAALIGGLRGIDLTYAMINDSRYAAAEWLSSRVVANDRIDHFGGTEKIPPLPPGVITARAAPHLSFHKKAPVGPEMQAQIAKRWAEDPPRFIIIMPDHSSRPGEPHHHTMPPPTFSALEDGRLGFHRVAFFETPSLIPWVHRPKLDYPSVNPPIRIYEKRVP